MAKKKPLHFRISGYLGGQPVAAAWTDGHLIASAELLEAARELIDCSYVFRADHREIPADLSDPLAALLTVIRCFGRIIEAKIDLPVGDAWGPLLDGGGSSWVFWGADGHPVGSQGSAGDLDFSS